MENLSFTLKSVTVQRTNNELKINATFFDSVEGKDNYITVIDRDDNVSVEMTYRYNKRNLIGDVNIRMLVTDIVGDYKAQKDELGTPSSYRKFIINELRLFVDEYNDILSENCFLAKYIFDGESCSRNIRRVRLSEQEADNIKNM